MRGVVQRVKRASVHVEGEELAAIDGGIVLLVGVGVDDDDDDARWLADKVRSLRIFRDDDGVMNRSLEDVGGEILAVSQFTLHGDARRGRRPSYIRAARPEDAERLYGAVIDHLRRAGVRVAEGRFQAMMDVELVNDGPVTILLDSERTF